MPERASLVTARLASLLDREQDRIVVAWASALSAMRPSIYAHRPLEELRRLGRAYLPGLVAYLDTGDPSRLREFIQQEAALRLGMGFGAAEVVQGFLTFRELVLQLCGELVPDAAEQVRLAGSLSAAVDYTVVEFVTHFQHLVDEREAGQVREVQHLQQALEERAVQDPVTELYIAPLFEEHLGVEIRRAARYRRALSMLICDLDGYDRFRSRFGERAADEALRAVAGALREQTREVDLKGRTDEAEFAVALPDTPLTSAMAAAERLRSTVEDLTLHRGMVGETRGQLTVSVGVGASPEHGSTAPELLACVRAARDRARMLGGNTVVQAQVDP